YPKLAEKALVEALGIDAGDKAAVRKLKGFLSDSSRVALRDMVMADPSIIGRTVPVDILASANIDSAYKGQIDLSVEESRRKVSDAQVEWMNKLAADGVLAEKFNTGLFTFGAS